METSESKSETPPFDTPRLIALDMFVVFPKQENLGTMKLNAPRAVIVNL